MTMLFVICDTLARGTHGSERGLTPATRIREMLDKYICSSDWLHLFADYIIKHGLRYKSNHVLTITRPLQNHKKRKKKRGFWFETCWLLDEGCELVAKNA